MKFWIICSLCFLFAAVASAQQDLETARSQTISGTALAGSEFLTLTLNPLDAGGASSLQSFEISAANETFSHPLKLFPGRNSIEVTGASGSQQIEVSVDVAAPAVRVQLTWAGKKQDYDLYVNDVYYGNTGADGGSLDRDVINQEEPATENITFDQAEGGLYRVYVNYFKDNEDDNDGDGEPDGAPQPTTVKVFVDDEEIYTRTRTISETDQLGASLDGDGKSVWNVCTVVIHSGDVSGGFTTTSAGYRDILPQKTVLSTSISPRTDFEIESFSGPNGSQPIVVPIGGSAQVTATGVLNQDSDNQQTDMTILEQFSSDAETIATIDALGVVTGISPGEANVSCVGFNGGSITVIPTRATFEEIYPSSGFDGLTTPHWLMVPVNIGQTAGFNQVRARTDPAQAVPEIEYVMASDDSQASTLPSSPASSDQTLTVQGHRFGDASRVEVRPKDGTAVLGSLHVSVKQRRLKTIAIHAVSEENDDVEVEYPFRGSTKVIEKDKGKPDALAIRHNFGVTHNLAFGGDDQLVGGGLGTGGDGICQTVAAPGDDQVIPLNQGEPDVVVVRAGQNDFLDTEPAEGEMASNAVEITTGPDGIRQTPPANNQNLVPQNVPTAAELENYLNDVYGQQTNTYFIVTRSDSAINYDLDRSGTLEVSGTRNLNLEEVELALAGTLGVWNLYFLKDFDFGNANGKALNDRAYIRDATLNILHVSAHELGHCFQLKHSDQPGSSLPNLQYLPGTNHRLQLMFSQEQLSAPTLLIKGEWDVVNKDSIED